MAKVWLVYEGKVPTAGEAWADLPLTDTVRLLDLEPKHFLNDLSRTPKFGDTTRDLTWFGYHHVVVEIGETESIGDWKSGFYQSPLAPGDAIFRIQVHRELGERWQDEWKKGQDSDGDPAIWLWVVLKADAPDEEWAWENRERIRANVRQAAAKNGVQDWVFVRFRKAEEETPVS